MKKHIGGLLMFLALIPGAHAVPFGTTDLKPGLYQNSVYCGAFVVSTIGLSGTALNGQTISFNIMFNPVHFLRSFTDTRMLGLQFHLPLDGKEAIPLGEFNAGTGYFLDAKGGQVSPLISLTGGFESNQYPFVDTDLSLFGFVLNPGLHDFYGFHFDFSAMLEGATVQENAHQYMELAHNHVIGVGPKLPFDIVPESGSTVVLFAAALGLLLTYKRYEAAK